jgi:hypothetical protein
MLGQHRANWLRSSLADELFALGQPLAAAEYPMIMPDAKREKGSTEKDKGRRLKTVANLARNREIECIALQPATDG